jgi:hypothetical protein
MNSGRGGKRGERQGMRSDGVGCVEPGEGMCRCWAQTSYVWLKGSCDRPGQGFEVRVLQRVLTAVAAAGGRVLQGNEARLV